MYIVAVERASRAEWWDLFCSQKCCSTIYGADDAELFTEDDFYERTGVKLDGRRCFACENILTVPYPA